MSDHDPMFVIIHDLAESIGVSIDIASSLESRMPRVTPPVNTSEWRHFVDLARTLIAEITYQHHTLETWLAETSYFGELDSSTSEWRLCDLYPIVSRLVEMYAARASMRFIELCFHSRDTAATVEATVDVGELNRAIHNLLSNAIKYSSEGDARHKRHINVWLRYHDSHRRSWCLGVQSLGVGIDEEERSTIVRPMVRGRRAIAAGIDGSGMGLSQASRFVLSHHGSLKIKSICEHDDVYLTTIEMIANVRPPRITVPQGSH